MTSRMRRRGDADQHGENTRPMARASVVPRCWKLVRRRGGLVTGELNIGKVHAAIAIGVRGTKSHRAANGSGAVVVGASLVTVTWGTTEPWKEHRSC